MMNQRLTVAVIAILAIGLAAAGYLGQVNRGASAPSVAAQTLPPGGAQPTGIMVVGEGTVNAQPDQAVVQLGVQDIKPTAQEAMNANSTLMNAVIAAVKAQGVADKDVRTGNISLFPNTAPPRPGEQTPPQITSYRASNTVIVTVPTQKAGAVLDAGVGAGANVSSGVQFGFQNSDKLRQEALQAAMKDARAKADAIAAGLGVKVTGVSSVSEQGVVVPRPFVSAAPSVAAPMAASVATPVQPGEQQITARADVTFNFQ